MGVQVDTCDPATGPLGAASRYSCARFGRCSGWRGLLGFRVKGWPLKQWERQDFCPRSFDIGVCKQVATSICLCCAMGQKLSWWGLCSIPVGFRM